MCKSHSGICVLADRTLFQLELTNQQLEGSTTFGRVNSDVVMEFILR